MIFRFQYSRFQYSRFRISRNWWQIVLGWSVVCLVALGQGPDPDCPTCNKNRVFPPSVFPQTMPTSLPTGPASGGLTGPLLPGVNEGPPIDLPTIPVAAPGAPTATPAGLGEEPDECPVPVIKVRLKAPQCAVVGKETEYRFRVENCTPTDAHHVIIRASVPASVKVLRTSPLVHAKEPELQWNLGTLAGFGCHDLSVVVVPIGLADIRFCTRVQFEYGQCATTKVIATAPEGSEGGAGGIGGPYGPGGVGPGGAGGMGTREPGLIERNRTLDVVATGPATAAVNEAKLFYKVTLFNRGTRPLYKVAVTLKLDRELTIHKQSDPFLNGPPGLAPVWPNPIIAELPPGASRSLDLELRCGVAGRFCLTAEALADMDPVQVSPVKSVATVCTQFAPASAVLTLEMFDVEDPILKDGKTRYPIRIENQGTTPATNVIVKAKIPKELLDLDSVFAPVRHEKKFDEKNDLWVVFDPIETLAGGETQTFNVSVKAKGQEGDARFHVEMTADQLRAGDKGQNPRWIIEEESTTIVPDQESLIRVREAARKNREKLRIVIP